MKRRFASASPLTIARAPLMCVSPLCRCRRAPVSGPCQSTSARSRFLRRARPRAGGTGRRPSSPSVFSSCVKYALPHHTILNAGVPRVGLYPYGVNLTDGRSVEWNGSACARPEDTLDTVTLSDDAPGGADVDQRLQKLAMSLAVA